MSNPHGTCETCAWHTVDVSCDSDGSTWRKWLCWRLSGAPCVRLNTPTDMVPPACESHLRESA